MAGSRASIEEAMPSRVVLETRRLQAGPTGNHAWFTRDEEAAGIFGGSPVVTDGRLVGILAQADIVRTSRPESTGRLVEKISA